MSNDLMIGGEAPSYLANVEKSSLAKNFGGSSDGLKRISFKGGVFRMMVGSKEVAKNDDRTMNMVVVASAQGVARTYYADAYKDGVVVAPSCWSDDGTSPSSNCENPQASSCADCPQNVAGSGQGNSRACRYSMRLAVVLEGDIKGDVYGVTLPATSIFGKSDDASAPFIAYIERLVARDVDPATVVTEFKFDTSSPVPKLLFKPVRYLNEAEYNTAKAQGESPSAKAHTSDRKFSMNEEVPFEKKAAPAEEVEEAAPKKVAKKKAEPVSEDADLAALVDEWGDD